MGADNNPSENEESTTRKQKNIRIKESYHDELEELAEKWFGSSQKQGHVVERLLDLYGSGSVEEMVREIHEEVVQGGSASTSQISHTQTNGSLSERDEELEEIIELADAGEPINPEEYDLTKVKGCQGLDRSQIWIAVLLHTHEQEPIAKEDVRDIIQDAGYSYNGANQQAKNVIRQLPKIPDLSEEINKQAQRDIQGDNTIKIVPGSGYTERQYGNLDSISDYVTEPEDFFDGYSFISEEEKAWHIYDDLMTLGFILKDANGSTYRRARNAYKVYVEALSEDVLDLEVNDQSKTIRERFEIDKEELF